MSLYAARTRVPIERSQSAIQALVKKHKATMFSAGWSNNVAKVEFVIEGRHVRLMVATPGETQSAQQRWRALLLLVKAKLVAVEAKVATYEEVFATDIVMPDGRTVWETIREPLKLAYQNRQPGPLLTGPH